MHWWVKKQIFQTFHQQRIQNTVIIAMIIMINNVIAFHVKSNRHIQHMEGPYFAKIPAPPVPVGWASSVLKRSPALLSMSIWQFSPFGAPDSIYTPLISTKAAAKTDKEKTHKEIAYVYFYYTTKPHSNLQIMRNTWFSYHFLKHMWSNKVKQHKSFFKSYVYVFCIIKRIIIAVKSSQLS